MIRSVKALKSKKRRDYRGEGLKAGEVLEKWEGLKRWEGLRKEGRGEQNRKVRERNLLVIKNGNIT